MASLGKLQKKSKNESKSPSTRGSHKGRAPLTGRIREVRSGKGPRTKVLVVVGPNASGKSELGIQLALMHNGEIISADSRQVYRGLDLTSGKVPGEWQRAGTKRQFVYKGVRHHLIDVASPKKRFTVQDYKKKTKRAIGIIFSAGKLPIIVGGSGFYIDTLIYDINIPMVPPRKRLREELEKLTTEQLVNRLKGLDPFRALTIDNKNRRRLVRAIEIVVSTGSQIDPLKKERVSPYSLLIVGIRLPDEIQKQRISKRIRDRVSEGMIEEVARVHKKGVSWRRLEELGLEFKYIARYLQGDIALGQMEEELEHATLRFARRQMTWFKRNQDIVWVDSPEKAYPIVQDFLVD